MTKRISQQLPSQQQYVSCRLLSTPHRKLFTHPSHTSQTHDAHIILGITATQQQHFKHSESVIFHHIIHIMIQNDSDSENRWGAKGSPLEDIGNRFPTPEEQFWREMSSSSFFFCLLLPCFLFLCICTPNPYTHPHPPGIWGLKVMEDANGAENVEEPVGTLAEYIEGIEAQELEADLVLGGDEGKECTYSQGYMSRQAVFACLTCTPNGDAGFCTACSLTCHDGHDVVELWTRRHFRCDCGNSKYGQGICKLQGDKDFVNTRNSYNQNYRGLYCTCHRVYPDPEGTALGEMLQCCICEDWFHESHLLLPPNLQFPKDEEGEPTYDELVCQACVPRCSFLAKYPEFLMPPTIAVDEVGDPVETSEQISIAGSDDKYPPLTVIPKEEIHENGTAPTLGSEIEVAESSNGGPHINKLERETDTKNDDNLPGVGCTHDGTTNGELCVMKKDVGSEAVELGRPLFLGKSWRTNLCRCSSCLDMYEEKGVKFLLDQNDTLQEYETKAKRKREETREQTEGVGSEFMQKLGHVQRIELLHGLNDMASELKSFLAPFGETGKTVTSADIHDFFENFNQKRRRHN